MRKTFLLFALLATLCTTAYADKEFVNLTPRPKTCSVSDGKCVLPQKFTVGVAETLGDTVMTEAQKFVDALNASLTGHEVTLKHTTEGALVCINDQVLAASSFGNEGYKIKITADSIGIAATSQAGFFYAFQSIKKMLPANVALGKAGKEGTEYALPLLLITDAPRFAFRSFMLDCSRHFFTVEELKRMIDIMAIYKMNTFQWHLTDDQGWRAEIKKYPRLTTVGATRSDSWNTDIYQVDNYWWTGEGAWIGKQYGPYFYTQEDMKEIVAYCAERHIEVIPEIEMPGHAVAAMVAYPEYSCTPSASRSVWTSGGISGDVMNVANAGTLQFCKDVIDEICTIFPGRYLHIGGDECPSGAWESNAECQALYAEKGYTNYRQLQSYFTNVISGYIASKGKRTIVWNESITAGGSDTGLVKEHNPIIMCWNPCQSGASQAANLGLDAIVTEYHSTGGGYYINRRQSNDYGEPTGAGYGDDSVQGCYEYVPVPTSVTTTLAKHYLGVQGTFWTEHVSSPEYLEYLALPRLICVAEAGWTTQGRKNWTNFKERLTKDTEMLDLGGYIYGKHWMDNYVHRVYVNPIHDGAIVTFKNKSTDRGRCLYDNKGTLNGQGSELTEWTLEAASKEGQYYIKSNTSGKYLYCSSTASGSVVTLSNTKKAWTFDTTTIEGYVAICPAANADVAINNNVSNTTNTRLFTHGSGNGASFWAMELVGEVQPDAITSISTSNNKEMACYDLQGRQVMAPHRGIYIMNGQKTILK